MCIGRGSFSSSAFGGGGGEESEDGGTKSAGESARGRGGHKERGGRRLESLT